MFEGLKQLQAVADKAKKVGVALDKIQKADANKNNIPDVEELKPLVLKAIAQSVELKATMDQIGGILGANFKEVAEALDLNLIALNDDMPEVQTA